MLVLASDGVWERASGEDILRWGKKKLFSYVYFVFDSIV